MTVTTAPASTSVRSSSIPSAMRLLWAVGSGEWTAERDDTGDVTGQIFGPYGNLIATGVPAGYVRFITELPRALLTALNHTGTATDALNAALLSVRQRSEQRQVRDLRHMLSICGQLPWSVAGDIVLSGSGHVMGADGHLDVVDANGGLVATVDVETLAGVGNARLIAEGPAVLAALLRQITGH